MNSWDIINLDVCSPVPWWCTSKHNKHYSWPTENIKVYFPFCLKRALHLKTITDPRHFQKDTSQSKGNNQVASPIDGVTSLETIPKYKNNTKQKRSILLWSNSGLHFTWSTAERFMLTHISWWWMMVHISVTEKKIDLEKKKTG